MKAGFYGGLVVDYPNSTKAKKFFLVLMTGGNMPLPKALGTLETSSGMNKFMAESKWSLGLFVWQEFHIRRNEIGYKEYGESHWRRVASGLKRKKNEGDDKAGRRESTQNILDGKEAEDSNYLYTLEM